MSDLVVSRGDRFVNSELNTAHYSEQTSRHHRPAHDDYTVAKMHIMQQVGNLDDIEIWGRQVLVGVYIKPNTNPAGLYIGAKEQREDMWQSKCVMVLKLGPDAFQGLDSYHARTFGHNARPIEVGDWLFANASAGIQISLLLSDTSSRAQAVDYRGRTIDLYDWDGWPCRIVGDDNFIGRIVAPHSVV